MAGTDCNLFRISSVSSGRSQLFPIVVKHRVIIEFDHHSISDPFYIGKNRPLGPSAIVGGHTYAVITVSVPVLDINRSRVINNAGHVFSNSQFLIIQFASFTHDSGV